MSHTAPKTLSDYRKDIDSALEDSFLRRTLDTFAVAYRANREAVFKEVDERGLIRQIADAKDDACKHMEELYEQFRRVAEERGVHVHRAATAEDANRIIASIARENNVKRVIKSKSMTAEEIQLNPYLEKEGFIVDETDLGEWIIQLRHEGPSHMVMPAIHLSRYQVADDFTKETGVKQDAEDIQRLVREAEAHASEDKKKQETIEARNHADSLIYGTEKSLNDLGDKVDAAVKSDVEGKIAALRKTSRATIPTPSRLPPKSWPRLPTSWPNSSTSSRPPTAVPSSPVRAPPPAPVPPRATTTTTWWTPTSPK